ncbi:MAG: T9SS type A sorting domain-containing protein [Fidelibacterota bacterium]|nr:MAG: T9SS type A sorting domain-containing protein [Candidatus Neomarinimicrobiota bacterium]
MRKNMLVETLVVLITLGLASASGQWEVFDCSQLPQDLSPPWEESNSSFPDDNETSVLSVIDDPDIPGNKLLKLDTILQGAGFKEMWRIWWGGDPSEGMTLVVRAAALDTGTYDRDLDIYILTGVGEERFITADNGTRVSLNRSASETFITPMNTTEWHIYRITARVDQFELYIDEDSISYLAAQGISTTEKYFRFGDGGSALHGALYDWIAWDTTGAYAPGRGTPLPDSLTGLTPISSVEDERLYPEQFELSQNYPNPFNPTTEIQFTLREAAPVRLDIYDLTGRLVNTLIDEKKQPGTYHVVWEGQDLHGNQLHSGVYFYSLVTDNHKATRKMLLLK